MTIRYFPELEQGSEAWRKERCGLLTASNAKLIVTPAKLQAAKNDKVRAHVAVIACQRMTKFVEAGYVSFDMLRGKEDEIEARALYNDTIAPVQTVGFVTNDRWGFTIGYSPDGLVGEDGAIEIKSFRNDLQIDVTIDLLTVNKVPDEHLIQMQVGLMVTERAWIDYIPFSGGLLAPVYRVYPDAMVQAAIEDAAGLFEENVTKKIISYNSAIKSEGARLIPTVRRPQAEDML